MLQVVDFCDFVGEGSMNRKKNNSQITGFHIRFTQFHSISCISCPFIPFYVIANSLRNHSLPTSLHHEISRMLLHLIGVVKLPELRPTCESFVLIDAINNGYNRDKNIIFNASTLNCNSM